MATVDLNVEQVHILFDGFSLCNKPGVPGEWPQGELWVEVGQWGEADCPVCLEVFRENTLLCARCNASLVLGHHLFKPSRDVVIAGKHRQICDPECAVDKVLNGRPRRAAVIESIPARVELKDLFRMSPGDPCPDNRCAGTIKHIDAVWMADSFIADARCGLCDSQWPVIEVPTMADVLESEANEGRKAQPSPYSEGD